MAQRVTEAQVREICGTSLTDEQITPFLLSASHLIDDVLVNSGYSDEQMADIEKWLAAHFVSMRDRGVASEKIGDAQTTYDGKTGMGLEASPYGQQVLLLDYKGKFAQLVNGKGAAGLKVVG